MYKRQVENLFTSGIISMFADACRIISIIVVIWVKNTGPVSYTHLAAAFTASSVIDLSNSVICSFTVPGTMWNDCST